MNAEKRALQELVAYMDARGKLLGRRPPSAERDARLDEVQAIVNRLAVICTLKRIDL